MFLSDKRKVNRRIKRISDNTWLYRHKEIFIFFGFIILLTGGGDDKIDTVSFTETWTKIGIGFVMIALPFVVNFFKKKFFLKHCRL